MNVPHFLYRCINRRLTLYRFRWSIRPPPDHTRSLSRSPSPTDPNPISPHDVVPPVTSEVSETSRNRRLTLTPLETPKSVFCLHLTEVKIFPERMPFVCVFLPLSKAPLPRHIDSVSTTGVTPTLYRSDPYVKTSCTSPLLKLYTY